MILLILRRVDDHQKPGLNHTFTASCVTHSQPGRLFHILEHIELGWGTPSTDSSPAANVRRQATSKIYCCKLQCSKVLLQFPSRTPRPMIAPPVEPYLCTRGIIASRSIYDKAPTKELHRKPIAVSGIGHAGKQTNSLALSIHM